MLRDIHKHAQHPKGVMPDLAVGSRIFLSFFAACIFPALTKESFKGICLSPHPFQGDR